jgi:heterodisulfide reductase subunit B
MIAKLKAKALALKTQYATEENKAKVKELGDKALQYAKDNPSDIMVGVITLMVMDMDDSLESIEQSTDISAYVDADAYYRR